MELKHYLELIVKRWKLVFAVAIVSVIAAAIMTSDHISTYESSGTFVVRPKILEPDETVRATEALNRGGEINSTFARIARSEVVRDRAQDALDEQGFPTSGMNVTTRVVPGTNILEIGAMGADPDAVAAYATALGKETAAYLVETGEIYEIQPLDTPDVPEQAKPSQRPLTLLLSLGFGVMGGAGLAFGVEYLREPAGDSEMNLIDDLTGAYRGDYFRLRLREELARCGLGEAPLAGVRPDGGSNPGEHKRPHPVEASSRAEASHSPRSGDAPSYRFSLGVITIVPAGDDPTHQTAVDFDDLRRVVHSLRSLLREQDMLAFIENDTFALIFPGMSHDVSEAVLDAWIVDAADDPRTRHLVPTIKVCECFEQGIIGNDEGMRIARAV